MPDLVEYAYWSRYKHSDDCPCASCLTIHDGCEKSYYEPKEGT